MQVNPSQRCERADESAQRAVLALVFAAHPKPLTIPALALGFAEGEAERAVRDLVGIGLLECRGISIRPTPLALCCHRLDSW
jgi:hypothetical protein